jgi:hypothetical protein
MNFKFLLLFFIGFLFVSSCNDPNNIGEGLLSEEKLNVNVDENFPILAKTIKSDNVISFSFTRDNLGQVNAVNPITGFIGSVYDSKFGDLDASFYTRIIYNPNLAIPKFQGLKLDSVVLVLVQDSLNFSGDRSAEQIIKVEEINEDYSNLDSIFVDKKLSVKPSIIGTKSIIPSNKDSISILSYTDSSTLRLPNQIRIPLDKSWAEDFVSNPTISDGAGDDKTLFNVFKGFKISSTSNKKGVMALNLSPGAIGSSGACKLEFYIRSTTNLKTVYSFYISSQRFNSFKLDNSTGIISNALNNQTEGEKLLYVQGMNGTSAEIDIDLTKLKSKNINKVELIMPLSTDQGSFPTFNPISQLIASYKLNGSLVLIEDISELIGQNLPATLAFDGALRTSNSTRVHSLNITRHIKALLKNGATNSKIVMTAANRAERINRTVFNGPKAPTNPLRLRVIYSD